MDNLLLIRNFSLQKAGEIKKKAVAPFKKKAVAPFLESFIQNNYKGDVSSFDSLYSKFMQTERFIVNGKQLDPINKTQLKKYIAGIVEQASSVYQTNFPNGSYVDDLLESVFDKMTNFNTFEEIDNLIVLCSSEMIVYDTFYDKVAVFILIKSLHRKTHEDYYLTCCDINSSNMHISDDLMRFIKKNREVITKAFDYKRDYDLSYFSYRTLERAYLKKANDKIAERPQHMFMRVSLMIHLNDINRALESYQYLSQKYFIHATPTLFNAGTIRNQLSSCFLLGVNDSMESIGKSWGDCAKISKESGGIGINLTKIRCYGSNINTCNGKANGLRVIPVYDKIAKYADQGGKRPGSVAIYIEPWHPDIFYFLDLRKNTGAESERARDIFMGMVINDIFMERVKNNEPWSLFCPNKCPRLLDQYGYTFENEYLWYERNGYAEKYIVDGKETVLMARDIWHKILEAQYETGMPYMIYKDAINRKSNHKNLGVINGSNLCAEIVEYHDADEYAVCNLSSICLPRFVSKDPATRNLYFDYQMLYKISRIATRNLNNIIDINYYPVPETKYSNLKNRPIGIGVQGLADVFAMFKVAFGSPESRDLNKKIFETIYFGALTESMTIAKEIGMPYDSYEGSPISEGIFQFNMWGLTYQDLSGMWNWNELRKQILEHGVRNSLVTALMPTASTSQIMNNNECFEPYTENIYLRTTSSGSFYIINRYLVEDLKALGMWNKLMIDKIKYYGGSIQKITEIPDHIKEIYKTCWEMPQRIIVEMAAERGPFVDQTQSMNIFYDPVEGPRTFNNTPYNLLTSSHFRAWELGLKTGMYYLRTRTVESATKFGIDIANIKAIEGEPKVCPLRRRGKDNKFEPCTMCDG